MKGGDAGPVDVRHEDECGEHLGLAGGRREDYANALLGLQTAASSSAISSAAFCPIAARDLATKGGRGFRIMLDRMALSFLNDYVGWWSGHGNVLVVDEFQEVVCSGLFLWPDKANSDEDGE